MVQVDDRAFLDNVRSQLLENLDAACLVRRAARAVEQFVPLRPALATVVQWLLASIETEKVTVRISPTAPCQNVGIELPLIGEVERSGKFGGLNLYIKTGLLGHGLHNLR